MTQAPAWASMCSRFLAADGTPVSPLPDWAADLSLLQSFYRAMLRTRRFDRKVVALQRTGQMGTYPACLGHEAVGVGLAHALADTDVFVPYYRDQAAQLMRGVSMLEMLLYWGGDERGNNFRNCREDFPNAVPIATQCTHAAGVATAFRVRGEKRVVAATCGDGATSRGDFLESINLAGAWQLPVVYLVVNNQWAISVPRSVQCAAPRLADKATGAGIPGEQVDGNDVIAVADAMQRAVARARAGKGATLIEAVTYRLDDHTTADDASRYRSQEELALAWEQEPVKRLRSYLHARGVWDELREKALYRELDAEIAGAVEAYLSVEPEPATAMLDYLYAELPPALRAQREVLARKGAQS